MKPWRVTFQPGESLNERLKKAAHVRPSPAQLKWMEREYIGFLHFSPNTLTGRQWGDGTERAEDFAPDALNPNQWARVCAEAGMRMLIPTLKHHDGFCQWHTESTDFSVEAAPVSVDIAAELQDACAENGIDLGIYLSPWDMHQRDLGVWGTVEYETVFSKQLQELLTKYGPIGELWLDGACGDRPIWEAVDVYHPEEWYDRMEALQPECVVRKYDPFPFADIESWEALKQGRELLSWRGKEVRWVGNEDGTGRQNEWSVQPVFSRVLGKEATRDDLGEEYYYEGAVGAVWYPNEVNTHLLNQWFWNEKTSRVRPLRDLVEIFYHSIGNNGTLLLNVSPDRHGRIPSDQIQRLAEFRAFMADTFGTNLADGATVQVPSQRDDACAANMLRAGYECWSPEISDWDIDTSATFVELHLPQRRCFDNLCLRENILEGQRVAHWRALVWIDGEWQTIAERKTIGYRRIVRFPAVTTDRIRIEILRSWDTPMLSYVGLYLTNIPETDDMQVESASEIQPLKNTPENLCTGVSYQLYEGGVQSVARIGTDGRPPVLTGMTNALSVDVTHMRQDFSICYDGYFYMPFRREVTFSIGCADGCILTLNEHCVIDLDEPHAFAEKTGKAVLQEGWYHLRLQYTSFRHEKQLCVRWTDSKNVLCPMNEELWYSKR